MTTATKSPKKSKPKEVRDLKKLPAALGMKKEKATKAGKPTVALASDTEIRAELRVLATTIRGLRHREEALSGELKEVRARITTLLDQEQVLILDGDKGQTRLALEPPNTGTAKPTHDAKAAATKAAHAPVVNATSTLLNGKRIVITRTGDDFVGTVVGTDFRSGVNRTFRGAAEETLQHLGENPASAKVLKWAPYEANGKAATPPAAASTAPATEAAKAEAEPAK